MLMATAVVSADRRYVRVTCYALFLRHWIVYLPITPATGATSKRIGGGSGGFSSQFGGGGGSPRHSAAGLLRAALGS